MAHFPRTGLAQPIQGPKGTAVIVGTVLDENHVPVVRAQVQAFSAEEVRQISYSSPRPTRSSGYASTDKTGTFRISGLAAGNYVVAAEAIPIFPGGGRSRRACTDPRSIPRRSMSGRR